MIDGNRAASCISFNGENTLSNGKHSIWMTPRDTPMMPPQHSMRSAANFPFLYTIAPFSPAFLLFATSEGTIIDATVLMANSMTPPSCHNCSVIA